MPALPASKIVFLDPPKPGCDLERYRNAFGELAIDLPLDTDLTLQKVSEEIIDLDKIISDYVLPIEIFADAKTRALLENIQNRIHKNASLYRAALLIGDIVHLDGYVYAEKTRQNPVSGSLKVSLQVIGTHQTWKDTLRNTCAKDLDLGPPLTHTAAGVLSLANNFPYAPGGSPYYPFFADFGRFHEERFPPLTPVLNDNGAVGININDVRYLVYDAALVKAMFALAGYCVKSRFLESHYGRINASYLTDGDYFKKRIGGTGNSILKVVQTYDFILIDQGALSIMPYLQSSRTPLDNAIYDTLNGWDNVNYRWTNFTPNNIGDIKIRINYSMSYDQFYPIITPQPSAVMVIIRDDMGAQIAALPVNGTIFLITGTGDTVSYDVLYDLTQGLRDDLVNEGFIPPLWSFEVVCFWQNDPLLAPTIKEGSFIEVLIGANYFSDGEVVDLPKTFSCSVTNFDILSDLKIFYGWRFRTDQASRTVEIEPDPARYEVWKQYNQGFETLPGFSIDQNAPGGVWDITDYTDVVLEIEKRFDNSINANSFVFKYKDSTDKHPEYEPFQSGIKHLWAAEIFQGNNNTGKKIENVLKIFEPTVCTDVVRTGIQYPTFLPVMWDNQKSIDEEGKELLPNAGANYAPRKFVVLGNIIQSWRFPSGAFPDRGIVFERQIRRFIPTVCQCPQPGFIFRYPTDATLIFDIGVNNVFRDNYFNFFTKDTVSIFYPDTVWQFQDAAELVLKVRMSQTAFACLNIRKNVRIDSTRLPLILQNGIYKILRVNYNVRQGIATVTLLPILSCDYQTI